MAKNNNKKKFPKKKFSSNVSRRKNVKGKNRDSKVKKKLGIKLKKGETRKNKVLSGKKRILKLIPDKNSGEKQKASLKETPIQDDKKKSADISPEIKDNSVSHGVSSDAIEKNKSVPSDFAKPEMPFVGKVVSIIYYSSFVFFILFGIIVFLNAFLGISILNMYSIIGSAILYKYGMTFVRILGVVLIVLGIFSFFIGKDIWNGKKWSRTTSMIFAIIGMIISFYGIIIGKAIGFIPLVVNCFVLITLTTAKVKSAFGISPSKEKPQESSSSGEEKKESGESENSSAPNNSEEKPKEEDSGNEETPEEENKEKPSENKTGSSEENKNSENNGEKSPEEKSDNSVSKEPAKKKESPDNSKEPENSSEVKPENSNEKEPSK